MSWKQSLYNAIFRRSSTFAAAVIVSAFVTERVIDGTADIIFDRINEGKQWKDIKPKEE